MGRLVNEDVVVVGAGTMGAGIARVAAAAGYAVRLVDPDSAALGRARARIGDAASVQYLTEIPHLPFAAVAIEAVPERAELKHAVLRALEAAVGDETLIATNTSALSVGDLAAALARPARFAGLHFFNPPEKMQLVEIVACAGASGDALERARAFVERLGKTAVEASDSPGFIVNRVARPFYLQAMRALERGVASIAQMDALARAAGFRMGPFELIDAIGLDVNLATSESVYERLGAGRLEPRPMQREMVAQGRLGRKSGAGFYDYSQGTPERLELAFDDEGAGERDGSEVVAVIGFGGVAEALAERLEERFAHVRRVENDDDVAGIDAGTTLVVDVGDGRADRRAILAELDSLLAPEAVVFADAYATDIGAAMAGMRHPERVVGYGILGAFERQQAVEIVDRAQTSDDALALAQELFESAGKGVVLVEDAPGLFLGRLVGSIVNEAVIAVSDGVANAEEIDLAMRLGVNYPLGPLEWGREIGGARIAQILRRLADAEGEAFAPHRALWVLDVEDEEVEADDART
jgi:3-hydroxybutyryl-CoA dehydrogenase